MRPTPRVGHTYLFKYDGYAGGEIIEAIMEVTDVISATHVTGDAIRYIRNDMHWTRNELSLPNSSFIREVTIETDPEYFL